MNYNFVLWTFGGLLGHKCTELEETDQEYIFPNFMGRNKIKFNIAYNNSGQK